MLGLVRDALHGADELVARASLEAGAVSVALTELELAGLVAGPTVSTELCDDAVYDRRVEKPYWLDERAEPLDAGRHDGPVDVAIVGGGVTGCSCALTLAEAGRRVRLYGAHDRLRRERAERRLCPSWWRDAVRRRPSDAGLNVQPRSGA